MKTIEINKPAAKARMGGYAPIAELVDAKLKRAARTLKNVDLTKINKTDWKE